MTETVQRFWRSVDKQDHSGCWKWKLSTDSKGYGQFKIGSRKNGTRERVMAHRFSYMLHFVEIPKGMYVLHRCDNPPCVNPKHLWLGTIADNNKDMIDKGRNVVGVDMPQSKLNEIDVRLIRALGSLFPHRTLAPVFGVSQATISKIVRHAAWRHIKAVHRSST